MQLEKHKRLGAVSLCATMLALCLLLAGCSDGGPSPGGQGASKDMGETTGKQFIRPELATSDFDYAAALHESDASIDSSHVEDGYVAASANSNVRLKFEVAKGGTSMYYDLPSDGTPIAAPLSLGNGAYTFTVWENTTDNRYAEVTSTSSNVAMSDEFEPFIRPSVYCSYDANSQSTTLANQLSANAENQGDVVREVYNWVTEHIRYDEDKAEQLAGGTGYIPNPDSTIAEGKGICFDYASLVAAMLRSQGIPCKIITGNVAPDDIYHAWNMIYIDGTWVTASIDIKERTWTRMDATFAASGDTTWTGNGSGYTDRYTY